MTVHVRRSDTGVSKHSGDTLPGVEVKDADVFVGAAGGHVLTRRIELNLPGWKKKKRIQVKHTEFIRQVRRKGFRSAEEDVTLSRLPSSLRDPL